MGCESGTLAEIRLGIMEFCHYSPNIYIYSLLMFVVNNMDFYHMTSQIHGLNTSCNLDLYCPQTNLTIYQRGPHYFGIKLFNHLPINIKELAQDTKLFS
jgi:hypothetical protein